MHESDFKHALGSTVELAFSKETGTVIGRAEYLNCENNYQVRYKCADGRQVESWWAESALTAPATS
jgi:hypothetical protein